MRRLMPWLPPVVWAAIVWVIGGINDVSAVPTVPGLDKVAHFALYGVLGFLLARAWIQAGARMRRVALAAVMLALALGYADERRQGRLPGRSQDIGDWFADAAGIATGFALALRLGRRRNENETRS